MPEIAKLKLYHCKNIHYDCMCSQFPPNVLSAMTQLWVLWNNIINCRQNKNFFFTFSRIYEQNPAQLHILLFILKLLYCYLFELEQLSNLQGQNQVNFIKVNIKLLHQGQNQGSKSRFNIKKVQKSRFIIKKFKSNCAFATPRHASAMCQRVNI